MIIISAFGANSNSGGEYVTMLLKEKYFDLKSEKKFRVVGYVNQSKDRLNKLLWIFIFLFCPIIHPQFFRRFSFRFLKSLKHHPVICFNFTQTFIYALFLPKAQKKLIVHDVLLQVELRSKFIFLVPIVYLWEYILFRFTKNAHIYTLSKKDKCFLMKAYFLKSENISVIDLMSLIDSEVKLKISERLGISEIFKLKDINHIKFGVIGAWSRKENSKGFQKFLDQCEKFKLYNLNLTIGGSSIEVIKQMNLNQHNVKILGFVDDLADFFDQIDILLIPLEMGGGVKIKVLQALASKVPCIGTEIAFEGITKTRKMLHFNDIENMVKFLAYS